MTQVLSFWAKLGDEVYPSHYHPVVCHLIDVAQVARGIWDRVLRGPLKDRISRAFGVERESCGRWLTFWISAHDIGKISPEFQGKSDEAGVYLLKRGVYFALPTIVTSNQMFGRVGADQCWNERLSAWFVRCALTTRT